MLKALFNIGGSNKELLEDFISKNATAIDVRTPGEYELCHVKDFINIPLHEIESSLEKIAIINTPIILCCRSGMRSGQAPAIVEKVRKDVINGGSWTKVNQVVLSK
jgi:rhodanese-related sulfurtransferase